MRSISTGGFMLDNGLALQRFISLLMCIFFNYCMLISLLWGFVWLMANPLTFLESLVRKPLDTQETMMGLLWFQCYLLRETINLFWTYKMWAKLYMHLIKHILWFYLFVIIIYQNTNQNLLQGKSWNNWCLWGHVQAHIMHNYRKNT